MLQIDFAFFGVESIRGFTTTFVAIFSSTSCPFGFSYRIKRPYLEIITFIVNTLRNQDKKVAFIQVDEYGGLFQLQMRISFPFLRAKDLRRFY